MRTPDRGSTTGAASWTDRARSKRAAPQGRAKRVNPPSPPYFKKSSYASTGSFLLYSPQGGMRTPDRGSTTGAASWTDRARSKRATPQGRATRVNPPSPPYFKKSSYASTGFFFACGTADIPGVGSNASPGLPDRTRQVARLSAAPPGGCPKTTKPGLARALLTV